MARKRHVSPRWQRGGTQSASCLSVSC